MIGNLSDKPQNDIKTKPTSMLSLAVSRLELVVLKLKDNNLHMQHSEKYRRVKANYLTDRMVPWLLLVGRSPVYSNLWDITFYSMAFQPSDWLHLPRHRISCGICNIPRVHDHDKHQNCSQNSPSIAQARCQVSIGDHRTTGITLLV